MKVKVKQTGEVIDVEFIYYMNRLGFRENVYADSFNGTEYYASELEKIDNDENVDKICNILKKIAKNLYFLFFLCYSVKRIIMRGNNI